MIILPELLARTTRRRPTRTALLSETDLITLTVIPSHTTQWVVRHRSTALMQLGLVVNFQDCRDRARKSDMAITLLVREYVKPLRIRWQA